MTRTSSASQAVRRYFRATSALARYLAELFKVAFPDYYASYSKAFEAGRWEEQDPGPFLGRAIVFKLDIALHFDSGEDGPNACFGCGVYSGAHMDMPGINARFRYAEISKYNSVLYHNSIQIRSRRRHDWFFRKSCPSSLRGKATPSRDFAPIWHHPWSHRHCFFFSHSLSCAFGGPTR